MGNECIWIPGARGMICAAAGGEVPRETEDRDARWMIPDARCAAGKRIKIHPG